MQTEPPKESAKDTQKKSVFFTKDTLAKLDEVASELETNQSEVIRLAVFEYLKRRDEPTFSLSRMAEVVEYTQIMLMQNVVRLDDAKHDAIISELDERLIEHHGR